MGATTKGGFLAAGRPLLDAVRLSAEIFVLREQLWEDAAPSLPSSTTKADTL